MRSGLYSCYISLKNARLKLAVASVLAITMTAPICLLPDCDDFAPITDWFHDDGKVQILPKLKDWLKHQIPVVL